MIAMAGPSLSELEIAAVDRVLRSGRLAQGSEVEAFEQELSCEMLSGIPTVAVSSGTAALHLLLLAVGVGPGDEVVVPSFTFAATANAVRLTGANAVFADIDDTYCLSPSSVQAAVTPRTSAILAVHLFGQPADMAALRAIATQHGILLLEDAAQAHGATLDGSPVGTLADGAAFSFYPTKNMTTGEGGAVCIRDPEAVRRVRLLRNQGMEAPYVHELVGFNLRMTEMAAAMGRIQLARLPSFVEARRQNAAHYTTVLADAVGISPPVIRSGGLHTFNQYTVRCVDRDRLLRHLRERGIESRVYYANPVHAQPAYKCEVDLPETRKAVGEVLSLPVGPSVGAGDRETIAAAILEWR